MKNRAKKGKMAIKKWFFRAKSEFLALKNYEPATKLERQYGAKCMICA